MIKLFAILYVYTQTYMPEQCLNVMGKFKELKVGIFTNKVKINAFM